MIGDDPYLRYVTKYAGEDDPPAVDVVEWIEHAHPNAPKLPKRLEKYLRQTWRGFRIELAFRSLFDFDLINEVERKYVAKSFLHLFTNFFYAHLVALLLHIVGVSFNSQFIYIFIFLTSYAYCSGIEYEDHSYRPYTEFFEYSCLFSFAYFGQLLCLDCLSCIIIGPSFLLQLYLLSLISESYERMSYLAYTFGLSTVFNSMFIYVVTRFGARADMLISEMLFWLSSLFILLQFSIYNLRINTQCPSCEGYGFIFGVYPSLFALTIMNQFNVSVWKLMFIVQLFAFGFFVCTPYGTCELDRFKISLGEYYTRRNI